MLTDFIKKPTTDFQAVRDGRQSLPFYFDVDLTIARSIAGGNPLIIEVAGNSFFSDADTTNGGNAVIHFQDTTFGITSAPFFVSPGFIANVAFTRLLIENTAQPGKRCRIFYGVDIDFQAGVNSSISLSGTLNIGNEIVQAFPHVITNSFINNVGNAANVPTTVFTPASNTNGIELMLATYFVITSGSYHGIIMHTSAPAALTDGILIATGYANAPGIQIDSPIRIPAGYGLYFLCIANEGTVVKHAAWRTF